MTSATDNFTTPNAATPVTVSAEAHPNIALVKYWGKRDRDRNLPAVGSVSITLDTLVTHTDLTLQDARLGDQLTLNGRGATDRERSRVRHLADCFRRLSGSERAVDVVSNNNFPTAAGLASSASGYAALVTAMDQAFQTGLSREALSGLARQGSGSAGRSLFGGFARMHRGQRDDGKDAVATPLLGKDEWPLEVVVAIASEQEKSVSSTVGMEATRDSSPFYQQWIDTQEADIDRAIEAIAQRDFRELRAVAEYSCLKMHGLMLSAEPGLVYWNHATVACIHEVRSMRDEGIDVFFTIDAGPQLKAVCAPGAGEQVAARLKNIQGVSRVLLAGLGGGARCVEANTRPSSG